MTIGTRRVFVSPDWFIQLRDEPSVAKHLNGVWKERYLEFVRATLDSNSDSGQHPGTIQAYCDALHRHRAFLKRQTGERTGVADLIVRSIVLRCPVSELFPEPVEWLAAATERFCGESIELIEAKLFSDYCIRVVQCDRIRGLGLHDDVIQDVASEQELNVDEVEEAIMRVMSELGKVLPETVVGQF